MSSQSASLMLLIWKTSFTYSPGTTGYGSWLNSVALMSHAADANVRENINENSITSFFM